MDKIIQVTEIWIRVEKITVDVRNKVYEVINNGIGERIRPVVLYDSSNGKVERLTEEATSKAILEFDKIFGIENVKVRQVVKKEPGKKTSNLPDYLADIVTKIDEIKEHGFSELEAIELLKVAELKKLNDQLNDTIYISGDVTAYPGRIE